jgi:hypothetical protein
MRMTFFAALAAFMILTLTGCGSDNSSGPPVFVTTILSDPNFDGDIQQDRNTRLLTISQGIATQQRLFAGLDPLLPLEYRSFLDFHLDGPSGVPANASIDSASLDLFINDIHTQFLNDTIPLRIELVSFQPPDLFLSDFDRPALSTTLVRSTIFQGDFGRHVTIDVTALMIEAQRSGLPDFQLRIMENFGNVAPGLIEINDTVGINRSTLAPQLTVSYF